METIKQVISTVQNGAVEFHTSGATIPELTHPDRFTPDLDPGDDVSWARLVEGALLASPPSREAVRAAASSEL